jgi:MSHA pilin protein MshC
MVKRRPLFLFGRGFTLTEIVVVIAIVGILSVFAAARFTRGSFDTKATYDKLFAQVTYARKVAIAQRRPVLVAIAPTQSTLCYFAGGLCLGPVPGPTGPSFVVPFGGASVTTSSFWFDGLGIAGATGCVNPGDRFTITVSGDGSHSFTVECDTGYVHP